MSSLFRRVLLFLLLLTALRLAYIGRVELSPDEAYYQMWSERLDWGYYSKGPGVAAIIRAGTALFGVNEFGVRFFSPLCALGTSLLLFGLTRRLYSETAAAWAVLLINVVPIFQAGALLMTIDAPSIFFWAAAMYACWEALDRAPAPAWWALAGVCVGLGWLCKFTNAMELLCITLALAAVPRWRREFRRPGFYVMLLFAAIIGSPPIIWNASHAWITFGHLRARGQLDNANFTDPFHELGEFWGGQFLVYSPLIFAGLLAAIVWGWRRAAFSRGPRRPDAPAEKARFLLAFGLPLLAMYGLLAFKTAGEPNWTAPSFIALSILAAALWQERAAVSRPARRFCAAALALGLVFSMATLDSDAVRVLGLPLPYERDPEARLLGWQTAAQAISGLREEKERALGGPVFLIANRYQLAAELRFYLADPRAERPGDPPVYLPESQNIENQFSLWPGYDQFESKTPASASATAPTTAEAEFKQVGANPFVGRSALYITDEDKKARTANGVEGRIPRLPGSIESGFEDCQLVAQYEIRRRGRLLRRLRVYACLNYKGLEL